MRIYILLPVELLQGRKTNLILNCSNVNEAHVFVKFKYTYKTYEMMI